MAGQKYFGELEGRLKRVTAELAPEKRVIWYIPDFLQIVSSGTHTGQSASILDQILPAITSGRLIVAGEATPTALTRILQNRPNLRSALEIIRLRMLTDREAVDVAEAFVAKLGPIARLEVDGDVVAAGMHLARQYLAAMNMPGRHRGPAEAVGQSRRCQRGAAAHARRSGRHARATHRVAAVDSQRQRAHCARFDP